MDLAAGLCEVEAQIDATKEYPVSLSASTQATCFEEPIRHLSSATPVRRSIMNRAARVLVALLSFNVLFAVTFATELVSVAKVLS
jgi:hypothetical protein